MKGLADIAGIRVGHASDFEALTGCTVILCEQGAVGGLDVRGLAAGTRAVDTFRPDSLAEKVHGVALAGGSAFGLEAVTGVMRYLERRGVGFDTGAGRVPIVGGAILYDLSIGSSGVRPTAAMGEAAAEAATDGPVEEGCVGAGTGATVGKLFGLERAMKGGAGSATVEIAGGARVAALAVVNAFGDVLDPASGRPLAGARAARDSAELADMAACMKRGVVRRRFGTHVEGTNTTLVVVATDAALNKMQAGKLASMAAAGCARALSPVHTTFDGDVVFALSAGHAEADLNALGVAAAEAVAAAIVRGVRLARSLGGVPGLAGAKQ
ncbi:MAG TPA: P1 family peptidase [Bryobacterales bacterium]|nr:P1 family peptidase [Bryobacterales bacterium]